MTSSAPARVAAENYRDRFPIFGHSIYLNSCSLGALSLRARARVNEYQDRWEETHPTDQLL